MNVYALLLAENVNSKFDKCDVFFLKIILEKRSPVPRPAGKAAGIRESD